MSDREGTGKVTTKREWMQQNRGRYETPGELARAAVAKLRGPGAAATGEEYKMAREVFGQPAIPRTPNAVADAQTPQKTVGKTLADFKQAYDKNFIIPQRIRAGLKALGSGWEYEVAFAKIAEVSLVDLGTFREQFKDYVVTLKRDSRRAWAGTTATAKAMREML